MDYSYNLSISWISNIKIKINHVPNSKTQRTVVPCLWLRIVRSICCKVFKKNKIRNFKVWDDKQKKIFKSHRTKNLKKTLAKVNYIVLAPGISLLKNKTLSKFKYKIITDIDLFFY